MRKIAATVLVLGLVACAPVQSALQDDPLLDPIAVCETRAGTVNILAALNENGQLSESVADRVDELVATTGSLCVGDEPINNAQALSRLLDGVRELLVIRFQEEDNG